MSNENVFKANFFRFLGTAGFSSDGSKQPQGKWENVFLSWNLKCNKSRGKCV